MGRNVILPVLEVFVCKRAQAASCSPYFPCRGPTGVGTFGTPAREFVDFLAAGARSSGRFSPGAPGGGNSPYMSPSSFAGNPLFLDLDELAEEGLLTAEELDSARRDNPDRVDYPWLLETRIPLLRKAWARGRARYARELAEFLEAERSWLPTTPCSWPCGTDSTESRWPTGRRAPAAEAVRPWKRPGRS